MQEVDREYLKPLETNASYRVIMMVVSLMLTSLFSQVSKAEDNIYPVDKVADGIYYHRGVMQDANKANKGEIANVSFIIGDKCVAVVDSGGSYVEGVSLRKAIRRHTDLPICYVINTHVHPDHVLGNAAFKDTKAIFVGNAKLPAAMAARETFYEKKFKEILGKAYDGSEFIPPTKLVSVGKPLTLDLGNRKIKLVSYPTAHTDDDLTVLDEKTNTFFTGDLLFVHRIPAIDGSINGWIDVLKMLKPMQVKTVVPGHGPVLHTEQQWEQALDAENNYFMLIRKQVRVIINDMGTITQATKTVGQSEKNKWLLFNDYNKRNVTAAFTELEWE